MIEDINSGTPTMSNGRPTGIGSQIVIKPGRINRLASKLAKKERKELILTTIPFLLILLASVLLITYWPSLSPVSID